MTRRPRGADEPPNKPGPITRFPDKDRSFSFILPPHLNGELQEAADQLQWRRGDVLCELIDQYAEKLTLRPRTPPPRSRPGPRTRFPHKSRIPFRLAIPTRLLERLTATVERLQLAPSQRGDVLCELIDQYARQIRPFPLLDGRPAQTIRRKKLPPS